jgi:hypothetical protein
LVQFTKTASAAIAAGGFLFLESIYDKSIAHRKLTALAGGILFLFGCMLRFECMYCVMPFLLIRFIILAFKKTLKEILVRFLLCIVIVRHLLVIRLSLC